MTTRRQLAAIVLTVATALLWFTGCGKKVLPQGLAGTYKIPLPQTDGSVAFKEMTIVSTGATFKGASDLAVDSITFTKVNCDADTSCAFSTHQCDGSLTKQPNGNVVVTATGICGTLAGTWLTEAAAAAAAPAEPKDRFPRAWRGSYFRDYEPANPKSSYFFEREEQYRQLDIGANTLAYTGKLGASAAPLKVTVACDGGVCAFKSPGAEGTVERKRDTVLVTAKAVAGYDGGEEDTTNYEGLAKAVAGPWSSVDPRHGNGAPTAGRDTPSAAGSSERGADDSCVARCSGDQNACVLRCNGSDSCIAECAAKGQHCVGGCGAGGGADSCLTKCGGDQNACVLRCSGSDSCITECAAKGQRCAARCM